jgi:WD40 repeat protein
MTDLRGPGTRVLLIGTAQYSDPSLPSLPSVSRSVTALSGLLRERCGVSENQCRVLLNPPDARTMAQAVAEEAQSAETVLVIYYLGHGLLGPGGELYLTASQTGELTPGLASHQALPFSAITEALAECRASCVAVILDCCFSGRPVTGLRAAVEPVFTLPATHGAYLLASAERLALAPEHQEFTTFSGALISLLTDGDRRGPRMLTLEDAYDFLFRTLRERGGPLPRRQAGDRSGELVLAVNPAQPEPEEPDDDVASPSHCPYLGLSAFNVDDAALFRGRERLIGELVAAAANALALRSPLVVVGPSGAGKSSLVHAGLLARLRESPAGLPGAAGWPCITLATPGDYPLQALAARLSPDRIVTADDLRQDPSRAADLVARLVRLPPRLADPALPPRLVLVIDQFEQLFVPSVSATERAAYLATIRAIARHEALVVLALRADFYGHAAEHPELLEALTVSQFIVGPMRPQEMQEAIEEPAKTVGLRLDPGLAEVILHELGAVDGTIVGSDALPLLSHALWAIWQHRSGSRLTMTGYHAVGRVTGAIATSAEEAYGAMSPDEQDSVRRMLPRLVRVGDEAPDTTRQLDRSALLRGLPDQEAAARALDRLTAARLVTLDRGSVRLSHEALIRSWPLLSGWVEADREWLKVSQRLAQDARTWQESGRDKSRLYRGGTLAGVRERAGASGRADELPSDAAGFLASSVQQERRVSRRRTAFIITLSLLLVLALGGGGTTLAFQRQADAQRNAALARLVAQEAGLFRSADPNLATQLSIIAYQIDHQSGTDALLASQGSPGILDDGEPTLDMAQSSGEKVVAVSTGTAIRLLNYQTGQYLGQTGAVATGPVVIGSAKSLLVGATGSLASLYPVSANVNTGSGLQVSRDLIQLWSITDPAHPRPLAVVPAHSADVVALALSPDERVLAAASMDGFIRIWDVADPGHPALIATLPGDGEAVYSLAFDPVGSILASTGADYKIRLWDLAQPAHPALLSQVPASTVNLNPMDPAMPHRVAFSADGKYLAGVTQVNSSEYPEVWNISNPRAPRAYVKPDTASASTFCAAVMGLAVIDNNSTPLTVLSSCPNELDVWQRETNRPTETQELQEMASLASPTDSQGTGTGGQMLTESGSVILNASPVGIEVWRVNSAEPGSLVNLRTYGGFAQGGFAVNSAGQPFLADTAWSGLIRLWSLSNPVNPRRLAYYADTSFPTTPLEVSMQANGIALSGNGKMLAGSEVHNGIPEVVLYRTARPQGAPVATIRNLSNGAIALALSSTGNLLAVSDNTNSASHNEPPVVKLYSLQDLSRPRLISALPGNTYDVLFSPDGRMLVALTANMMLTWDISDPSRPVELPAEHLSVASGYSAAAFSPDGALLAVKDGAGVLRLWHVGSNRLMGQSVLTEQASGTGTSVAFSPDGQTLAVAALPNGNSNSPVINLWDVANPAVPRLDAQWAQPDESTIYGLGFSSNGQVLAVEGQNYINLWSTNPALITSDLCADSGDAITPAQWNAYVPGLPYRPPCAREAIR